MIDETTVEEPQDGTESDIVPPEASTMPEPAETKEEIPEEIRTAILSLVKATVQEDETIRIQQLQKWRGLQLFWEGFQDIFWDSTARDWRTFSDETPDEELDKVINIYRAHGESVIAALSIQVPGTAYFPDDAESPDDVRTAQAYDAITDLIQKHNDAKLLIVRALTILWNQGTIFAYNYHRKSPDFGTIPVPIYKSTTNTYHDIYCESCGNKLDSVSDPVTDVIQCSACGWNAVPESVEQSETVESIVDYRHDPKGRISIDLFGPMNVKVPFYARKQADIGYLHLNLDQHHAMVKNIFKDNPDVYDKIEGAPGFDTYERYMRLPNRYLGQIPRELAAIKCVWFRPWMYHTLDADTIVEMEQLFPKGCYALIINDNIVAQAYDESLDKCWTISHDPLSEYIHAEALGKPLQDIQVMTNDLTNLTLQTIEYGIPETFADPLVLDFDKYGKSKAAPGMVTPTRAAAGKDINQAFHTIKTAALSQEVEQFNKELQQSAQFVVGDFPSVYGGPSEGSKTATEYQQSGARALQRLSLTYTRVTTFWSKLMSKCATEFVEQMQDDERYVKKENGRFINVWIRKSSLSGKIGHVEPETNEQLPQSWVQKRDQIMNLMKLAMPAIDSVLYAPENAEVMKQAFATPEIWIPGEEDRLKQLEEIYQMMNVQSQDGQMMFDGVNPTVPIDPDIDDHEVHIRIMKKYLNSMQGIEMRTENPAVYANWIAHFRQHQMIASQQAMQMQQQNQQSGSEGSKQESKPSNIQQ